MSNSVRHNGNDGAGGSTPTVSATLGRGDAFAAAGRTAVTGAGFGVTAILCCTGSLMWATIRVAAQLPLTASPLPDPAP
jgi:hypothetical protein